MTTEVRTFETLIGLITWVTMTNASGASVTLSSLGAGIVEAVVPDKDGKLENVVLGYDVPEAYLADGPCAGKVPGRYANRIAKGHLELDGKVYPLAINNGPNALHGGPTGFQNRIWECSITGKNSVCFARVSPDGEENYPGTLAVKAEYSWTDDNVLTLRLTATVDGAPTVVNLTNHAYFNLTADGSGSVLDHLLQINAERWLPTDDTLIPTGEMAPVEGTPMDFRKPTPIGEHIHDDFDALRFGKGYDNCWVLKADNSPELKLAAVLQAPDGRRTLEVATDQPGVQVYTGNWLNGCPAGHKGAVYHDYDAVAIECQGLPDAPNKPNFPTQRLNPGETYSRTIQFTFK